MEIDGQDKKSEKNTSNKETKVDDNNQNNKTPLKDHDESEKDQKKVNLIIDEFKEKKNQNPRYTLVHRGHTCATYAKKSLLPSLIWNNTETSATATPPISKIHLNHSNVIYAK